jgi:peptidoglycan/LPS O-acetylase OafA/YrhL
MAALRRTQMEPPDVHARLMSVYPPVPEWWYASVFVGCFAAACVCIQVWDYDMTIWALVVALLIAAVYLIPVGQHSVSSSNDSHTDEFQG